MVGDSEVTATVPAAAATDLAVGSIFMPYFWIGPDWLCGFYPDHDSHYQQRRREQRQSGISLQPSSVFLFGDGNPNAGLLPLANKLLP